MSTKNHVFLMTNIKRCRNKILIKKNNEKKQEGKKFYEIKKIENGRDIKIQDVIQKLKGKKIKKNCKKK